MTERERQREIKIEWLNFTGFEFMGPERGQSFYHALQKNRQWLQDHVTDALRIGDDVLPPGLDP